MRRLRIRWRWWRNRTGHWLCDHGIHAWDQWYDSVFGTYCKRPGCDEVGPFD